MTATGFFADLLATLLERRPRSEARAAARPLDEACRALLSGRGEVSGASLAHEILAGYRALPDVGKRAFFVHLAEGLDIDPDALAAAAARYGASRDPDSLRAVHDAAEPPRQELLRRLNQAPGATADLVAMRRDLLRLADGDARLMRIDLDFTHLFSSWFNRGFLVLRPIDWTSPALILERIIAYEAVHAINDWDDLRRRLLPGDRRCFAFFHPAMPDDPLIFVEVALVQGIPGSIQAILAPDRAVLPAAEADTAVFYSISNCQEGLRGISFGSSLIKQVIDLVSRQLPHIRHFITLSPMPGLVRYLTGRAQAGDAEAAAILAAETVHEARLREWAALYLAEARRVDGMPVDPVARFHLGNGAVLHRIHAGADTSANGLRQSLGAMVNYLYDPATLEANHEAFATRQKIAHSREVRALLKAAREAGIATQSG